MVQPAPGRRSAAGGLTGRCAGSAGMRCRGRSRLGPRDGSCRLAGRGTINPVQIETVAEDRQRLGIERDVGGRACVQRRGHLVQRTSLRGAVHVAAHTQLKRGEAHQSDHNPETRRSHTAPPPSYGDKRHRRMDAVETEERTLRIYVRRIHGKIQRLIGVPVLHTQARCPRCARHWPRPR